MTRRINYEDDIFTVALHVRCLQDTLKLDVDPELFRDRVLGDIAWIDATINRLYQSLRESSVYVKRQDYLRELSKLKRAFIDALDGLLEQGVPLADHLADSAADLRSRRELNARDIDAITGLLAGGGTADEEHIVSAEELRFLMTAEDEEDDAAQ
jgi:hypothetical protein